MKAIILVGGFGTRLYPMTYSMPKAMVPLLNRPFLTHVLAWLARHKITDVILSTCYMPDAIEDYFGAGEGFGARITYVQESEPLGTGGAVKNCQALVHGDEPFLVLNGDILTALNLQAMRRSHARRNAHITLSLARVEDPTCYGVVETDKHGRVLRFVEKPPPDQVTSHHINAGVYIFSPPLLDKMPSGRFSLEREFFPDLLRAGARFFAYSVRSYWLDVGTAESYRQAHWDVLDGKVGISAPGAQAAPGLWAGPDARLGAGVEIKVPVVLGSGCRVADGATLGPYCVLGDNVSVESGVRISRSVVWSGCRIGPGAAISDSIIGRNQTVPADSIFQGQALGDQPNDPSQAGGTHEQG